MRAREHDTSTAERLRGGLKQLLAAPPALGPAQGASLLIYHRIGGGTRNELDLAAHTFVRQLDLLGEHDVLALDAALDRLDAGDHRPSIVVTFDDGFEDVYRNAWPVLRERSVPFTIYLASAFVGTTMVWEGATARGAAGHGLTWRQLEEMLSSGLCTIGNHTHDHVRPEALTPRQLDQCSEAITRHLGVVPRHFTYPWGLLVPDLEPAIRERFRSASTGVLGRNLPATDRARLHRIPVRRSDPQAFFARKLSGRLGPERTYAALVRLGKAARRPR